MAKNNIDSKSFDEPNKVYETPLHTACEREHDKVVKVLTEHPELINFNAMNMYGQTAFHIACIQKNNTIVELLIATEKTTKIKLEIMDIDSGFTGRDYWPEQFHFDDEMENDDIHRKKLPKLKKKRKRPL